MFNTFFGNYCFHLPTSFETKDMEVELLNDELNLCFSHYNSATPSPLLEYLVQAYFLFQFCNPALSVDSIRSQDSWVKHWCNTKKTLREIIRSIINLTKELCSQSRIIVAAVHLYAHWNFASSPVDWTFPPLPLVVLNY